MRLQQSSGRSSDRESPGRLALVGNNRVIPTSEAAASSRTNPHLLNEGGAPQDAAPGGGAPQDGEEDQFESFSEYESFEEEVEEEIEGEGEETESKDKK